MTTSDWLFLTGVACGVFFAGVVVWAQAQGPRGLREVSWKIPAGFVVFGAAFGSLAYLIDSGVAEKTLYEIDAPGGVGVQEFRVAVEHPGAEHSLLLDPQVDGDAPGPVEIAVFASSGNTPLVSDTVVLDVDCSGRSVYCGWESWTGRFAPGPGTLTVRVHVRTPGIETLHLRVEDPEKTDGVRAPGY
ncbi:MAG: hypothetical protein AB7J32_01175 [Pseudonocardia sp.]